MFTAVLGLPFLSASPVKSLTHLNALCVYSKTYAPGEKPKLETVLEQRITGVFVHIIMGKLGLPSLCLQMVFYNSPVIIVRNLLNDTLNLATEVGKYHGIP